MKFCAWSAFLEAVKNFWGNRKAVKYKGVVAKLLLQDMDANMSIKTNMLTSNLSIKTKRLTCQYN